MISVKNAVVSSGLPFRIKQVSKYFKKALVKSKKDKGNKNKYIFISLSIKKSKYPKTKKEYTKLYTYRYFSCYKITVIRKNTA